MSNPRVSRRTIGTDVNKGRNLKLMKVHNRALVLRTIQQHEKISRKEISRLTDLTPATITTITDALLDLGLIIEMGKDTRVDSYGGKRTATYPWSMTVEDGFAWGMSVQ